MHLLTVHLFSTSFAREYDQGALFKQENALVWVCACDAVKEKNLFRKMVENTKW